ncbi:hypothetical protein FNT36_14225 [Hymenobacter setariae]|uniref:Uncharacterized protein n=1 Tax=Hymenobacter setariae TaxID=2594794 RepID=A0A558BVU5_9BACT|nr:hypothetical protein [Hymenobacter setariae]TVT40622.1 hypothetical protein FNT36_14225 [Hymenobacter setariae]
MRLFCFFAPAYRFATLGALAGLLLLLPLVAPAQATPPSIDYYAALKGKNLSSLWLATSRVHPDKQMQAAVVNPNEPFPDPIGFIGPTYQRFYLHYTSIRPDAANSYLYHVAGKTRVKDNICAFMGTITVVKARLYKEPNGEYPQYREGELTCQVALAEDRQQPGSGIIRGTLTTYFYVDKQGQPHYNLLEMFADGFSNNECVGTWTSYASQQRKTCNWGDFFIPEANALRFTDTEFQIAPKYRANGWQTYQQALLGDARDPGYKKAVAEEKRAWWK